MSNDSTFETISKEIAQDFLQNVLIIDDDIQEFKDKVRDYEDPIKETDDENENTLDYSSPDLLDEIFLDNLSQNNSNTKKQELGKTDNQNSEDHIKQKSLNEELKPQADHHIISYKEVLEEFADKNILCTIFNPTKEELKSVGSENYIKKTFQRSLKADILILDWKINPFNQGQIPIGIIKEYIASKYKNRIRLFIIYSAEIIETIATKLETEFKNNITVCYSKTKNERPFYQFGGLNISVLTKKDKDIKLPDQCINEFYNMNKGLIPNATLKALTAIRENTFFLLSNLNPYLDPAFLSHRALLETPEDAENHLIEIISSEIQSLLENKDISNTVNIDIIKLWIDQNIDLIRKTFDYDENKIFLTKENIIHFLNIGTPNLKSCHTENMKSISKTDLEKGTTDLNSYILNCKERIKLNKSLISLTEVFNYIEKNGFDNQDNAFSLITTLKSFDFKNEPYPHLTLGSIIKEDNGTDDDTYFLCLQPRCDSTRIKPTGQNFLFLPLKKCENNNKDLIVYDNGYKTLRLGQAFEIFQKHFTPKEGKNIIESTVITNKESLAFLEKPNDNSKKYYFIGELKTLKAQQIINKLSAKLCRVGINESEMFRRITNKVD